jgi:hypothetical protein
LSSPSFFLNKKRFSALPISPLPLFKGGLFCSLYVGVAVYGTPQEYKRTTTQPAKATQINA